MKRMAAVILIAATLLLPGVTLAGSSTDAALGLGAFAVFNQILSGTGIFGIGRPAVVAPAPVYVAPPAPVVVAPRPVIVTPPPVYVAPRPVIVTPPPVVYGYRAHAYHPRARAHYVPAPPAWGHDHGHRR